MRKLSPVRSIFVCLAVSTLLASCYAVRAFRFRKFHLNDHKKLSSVNIQKPAVPFHFANGAGKAEYSSLATYLDTNLALSKTAAFLVIRNDSLIYERYFNGFSQSSLLPSFSVAKSFVGTLIGIAVDEGKLSMADPVTRYLPELLKRDKRFAAITVQHLMDMRSGIQFNEGTYNLKDAAVKLGFRPNLLKHALKINIEGPPGGPFKYKSINTELLAIILERATGKRVAPYMQEKLWQPLGAEYKATWNTDSKKHQQEIAFAGLNATARDFAKLGQLYLQHGAWQGRQLISRRWTDMVANKDTMEKWSGYKNQWWSKYTYLRFPDSLAAAAYKIATPYTSNIRRWRGAYRVGHRTSAFNALGF
jgi:CubicO group peptidase (beta-lactamase class C family)